MKRLIEYRVESVFFYVRLFILFALVACRIIIYGPKTFVFGRHKVAQSLGIKGGINCCAPPPLPQPLIQRASRGDRMETH